MRRREAARRTSRRFQHSDVALSNFAEDTYIVCATPQQASYVMAVVAKRFARGSQHLNVAKSEALATSEGRAGEVQAWDDAQLDEYVAKATRERTRTRGPEAQAAAAADPAAAAASAQATVAGMRAPEVAAAEAQATAAGMGPQPCALAPEAAPAAAQAPATGTDAAAAAPTAAEAQTQARAAMEDVVVSDALQAAAADPRHAVGARPSPVVRAVAHMTVLGARVTAAADAEKSVQESVCRAWHAWSQIRAQCVNKRIPLRARTRLSDAVVLPTLMWGPETLSLTRAQRRHLDALQRVMLQNAMRMPRRGDEDQAAFCRRRERVTTARFKGGMRSPWVGGWGGGGHAKVPPLHVLRPRCEDGSRAPCSSSLAIARVASVCLYGTILASKSGGQTGRRPAGQGVPRRSERAIQDTPAEAQRALLPIVSRSWQPSTTEPDGDALAHRGPALVGARPAAAGRPGARATGVPDFSGADRREHRGPGRPGTTAADESQPPRRESLRAHAP